MSSKLIIRVTSPTSAEIQAEHGEYTFGHILQTYLLQYQGPLGTLQYCGMKVDEPSNLATLVVHMEWNDLNDRNGIPLPEQPSEQAQLSRAESLFHQLMRHVLLQVRSVYTRLKSQFDQERKRVEPAELALADRASDSVANSVANSLTGSLTNGQLQHTAEQVVQ